MNNLTFKTLSSVSQKPLITKRALNIAVAGTGYVGLVSGVCMAIEDIM